jgi:hypothetical protein
MEDACRLAPVPADPIREALRISGVPGPDAECRANLTRGRLSAAFQHGPLIVRRYRNEAPRQYG